MCARVEKAQENHVRLGDPERDRHAALERRDPKAWADVIPLCATFGG